FGSRRPEADAEVISLAIDALKSVGLKENDFVVFVNNRRMLQGTIKKMLGIGEEKVREVVHAVDKKDKMEEKEFNALLAEMRLSDEQIDKLKEILEIDDLKRFSMLEMDTDAKAAFAEFSQVVEALKLKKKYIKFNPCIVRGLDYYTDTVFEIFDKERKFRAICGGGRYDKMIESFGGIPCPATGFGMGYSTLTLLLQEKGLIPNLKEGPDFFIASVNDGVRAKSLEIANLLRKKNSVEIDLLGKNLRNQFDLANSIKAKKVVIVGPDELKENKVVLRDMIAGTEQTINIDKLLEV
ncbi:MAG: ATP phosphoribosyltransferase regulatory subunit, partial [Nanoarchaeota archaeon]|nr:ATP phosphoribosyltransferase regulatory subunit [Nanoarchaeota archaeon]